MAQLKPITLETQKDEWRKWPRNKSWDGHPNDEVEVVFAFNKSEPKRTYLAHQLNWKGFNDETSIKWVRIVNKAEEE